MHRRRAQVTIAAVTFALGLLVVVQLQTQASGAAFAGREAAGAAREAEPSLDILGVHFFTFGSLEQTSKWVESVRG